jgi:hypothetical protein
MTTSALQGDTLGGRRTGDWRSVDGILASLRVADASREAQRSAIAEARERPGLAALLQPLEPQLRTRGLID